MAIDISLIAVPKEAERILQKATLAQDSEYPDAVFGLSRALENTFTDFGHPDWIALKNDAQDLLQYYPKKNFNSTYCFDPNRTYEVFDYLFAKKENPNKHFKDVAPFFYDGIVHKTCISGQGFNLKYWDVDLIQAKKALFDSVSFESLYEFYDYEDMIEEGVYKIQQLHTTVEEIQNMFACIQLFLENALTLNGYVLVMKC